MSERMSRVNVSCNDIPNVAVAMQMLQNATKCCPKKVKLPTSNGAQGPMPGRVDRMGTRERVQHHDVQFLPYLQPAISSLLLLSAQGNIGNAFFS